MPGQVITLALIHIPPEARAIIVAGRRAVPSRAAEVMINEAAAQILNAHVGSVIQLRGFRPDQLQQALNGAALRPEVTLPAVRVAGIIRTPGDLSDNPGVPTDVTFAGTGFHQRDGGLLPSVRCLGRQPVRLTFHLKRGAAGLAAFEARGKAPGRQPCADPGRAATTASWQRRPARNVLAGAGAVAVRGHRGAGDARHRGARASPGRRTPASDDFPVLRALGTSPRQLFAVALAPGALVAAAGMVLAIPVAYGLSAFTPIGLARRAEISPGFSFNAAILLGGAAAACAAAGGPGSDHGAARAQDRHRHARGRGWEPGFTGGAVDGRQAVPADGGVGRAPGVRAGPRPHGRPGPLGHLRHGGGARRGDGGRWCSGPAWPTS